MSQTQAIACPRCQIGHLQPITGTYSDLYHGMPLSVPDVPAWMCDVCRYEVFDDAVILQLEAIVGQLNLSSQTDRARGKLTPAEADLSDRSVSHRLKP